MTPLKSSNRRDLNRFGLRVAGGDDCGGSLLCKARFGVVPPSCWGSWEHSLARGGSAFKRGLLGAERRQLAARKGDFERHQVFCKEEEEHTGPDGHHPRLVLGGNGTLRDWAAVNSGTTRGKWADVELEKGLRNWVGVTMRHLLARIYFNQHGWEPASPLFWSDSGALARVKPSPEALQPGSEAELEPRSAETSQRWRLLSGTSARRKRPPFTLPHPLAGGHPGKQLGASIFTWAGGRMPSFSLSCLHGGDSVPSSCVRLPCGDMSSWARAPCLTFFRSSVPGTWWALLKRCKRPKEKRKRKGRMNTASIRSVWEKYWP